MAVRRITRRTTAADGGLIDEEVVETDRKPRIYKGPWRGMVMLSIEGLHELSERMADHSLGMQAMRVLTACMLTADKENRVQAGRKDLARRLGMSEPNVHRALQALVDCGFLEAPKLRFSPYVISPTLFWQSSTDNLRKVLAERGMIDKNGMMKAKDAA